MKRLAILTSGGDAPGMNAAVRAAALTAAVRGVEVLGIRRGYAGLLEGEFCPLGPAAVQPILREGGTVLGSARCLEFHERKTRDRARDQLRSAGIGGLVVIGGNGSLTGLHHLLDEAEGDELHGIGVPASIDNDVGATRLAIGVDTAVNTIVEACDKISDTAAAHDRTFVVEVMGRDCGYLAMAAGIAAGANAVLFPEQGRTEDELVETVARAVLAAERKQSGSRRVLVLKAEGVSIGLDRLTALLDARLRAELGRAPRTELRHTVLGHVVRGGRPSALDRIIGSRLGAAAAQAVLSGESKRMAAWSPPRLPPEVCAPVPNDPQCSLVDLGRVLEETRAMLGGSSPFVRWRKQTFEQIEDMLSL